MATLYGSQMISKKCFTILHSQFNYNALPFTPFKDEKLSPENNADRSHFENAQFEQTNQRNKIYKEKW